MDRRKWDRIVAGGWFLGDLLSIIVFALGGGYSGLTLATGLFVLTSWILMTVVQAGIFFGKKWAFWVTIVLNAIVIFVDACELLIGRGSTAPSHPTNYGILVESAILFAYSLYVLRLAQTAPVVEDSPSDT